MENVRELIENECDAVCELLLQKNREYGNSALDPVRVFSNLSPIEQIKVRIDDKLSRIATVGEGGEIKEDTVQDLIGYLVLLRVAQRLASDSDAQAPDKVVYESVKYEPPPRAPLSTPSAEEMVSALTKDEARALVKAVLAVRRNKESEAEAG